MIPTRTGNLDVLVWYANNVVGIPTNDVYEFLGKGDGTFAAPKLVLPNFYNFGMADINGDGRANLIEADGWRSSYHIIPATPRPTVQLQLASQPIVGPNGTLIVNLALPAMIVVATSPIVSEPDSTFVFPRSWYEFL
jgi:hypothetical protein